MESHGRWRSMPGWLPEPAMNRYQNDDKGGKAPTSGQILGTRTLPTHRAPCTHQKMECQVQQAGHQGTRCPLVVTPTVLIRQ